MMYIQFRKLLIDIRIYFWLKENTCILALIHLRVLLLNNYEISSIYDYPVWRKSRAKQLNTTNFGKKRIWAKPIKE
jgi:hypothetical protein